MIVGVTGTREALTRPQAQQLRRVLTEYRSACETLTVHHGACTGADATAHTICKSFRRMPAVVVHPGVDKLGRSPTRADPAVLQGLGTWREAAPYRVRDQAIVNACEVLIACPQYPEDDPRSARSGTWLTVRLARKAGKPIYVIAADGSNKADVS